MTDEEKRQEIAESTSYNIPWQYLNKKNQKLVKELALWMLDTVPVSLDKFYFLESATGQHLTDLAYTFFKLSRETNGITLSDEELLFMCKLRILYDNIDCFNIPQLKSAYRTIFGDADIETQLAPHELHVSIRNVSLRPEIIQLCANKCLFPIPCCTKLVLNFTPRKAKAILFPLVQKSGYFTYNTLYGPPSKLGDKSYNLWQVPSDIHYIQYTSGG